MKETRKQDRQKGEKEGREREREKIEVSTP